MKISYIKTKSRYLIIKEDGTSELLKSEEEFNNFLTDNECEIVE